VISGAETSQAALPAGGLRAALAAFAAWIAAASPTSGTTYDPAAGTAGARAIKSKGNTAAAATAGHEHPILKAIAALAHVRGAATAEAPVAAGPLVDALAPGASPVEAAARVPSNAECAPSANEDHQLLTRSDWYRGLQKTAVAPD
jgi:hypothetical protein